MLTNVNIQQAIKELAAPGENARIATAEERQAFWTAAMRGEIPGYEPKDQLKASELLGKAQGDFIIRHEVNEPMQLVVYLPDNGRDTIQTA